MIKPVEQFLLILFTLAFIYIFNISINWLLVFSIFGALFSITLLFGESLRELSRINNFLGLFLKTGQDISEFINRIYLLLYGMFLYFYLDILISLWKPVIEGEMLCQLAKVIYFSVLVGTITNHLFNLLLWLHMPDDLRQLRDKNSFVNILGTLEIILYLFSFYTKHPEFIAFWITTKIAVTWQKFAEQKSGASSHHIFLIGNAMNIIWAAIGIIIAFGPKYLIAEVQK